jgi:(E)-4-hydroxy-3-methyl-but-2-enyl pyrophosphate reductase
MSIKLAETAGFCMGVRRAVDLVLDLAQHKGLKTIYTYGPLIHNPQTVELLKSRGIIPVSGLEEIPPGEAGLTIIIRAHGISPQERQGIKAKGLKIIDATCPKVGRVQAIIKKHAAHDFTILIIGDAQHPEVNGLLGYAYGKGLVINHPADVRQLPPLDKVCVVAQTTQSVDEYQHIVAEIRQRFPAAVIFDTICDSTEKRQLEVKSLAEAMDAMIIVGGKNSANTQRLAALSALQGAPTFQVETANELIAENLQPFKNIGISAGASTPNWIIDGVVDNVTTRQTEQASKGKLFLKSWIWMVRTDIYAALGAGCLAVASMLLQSLAIEPLYVLITALYVYAMHTLNRFLNRQTGSIIGSFREDSYRRHEKTYIRTAVASLMVAFGAGFVSGPVPFLLLLTMSTLGILYNAKLLPAGCRFRSVKDLPGSKNVSMAFAWAAIAAVLPPLAGELAMTAATGVSFAFIFGIVFIRSALSDVLDIQSDKLIGRETIPVLIGKTNTQNLLHLASLLLLLLLSAAFPLRWTTSASFFLLPPIIYLWICFQVYDRKPGLIGVVMEGILETAYIIAGLSAGVWLLISRGTWA